MSLATILGQVLQQGLGNNSVSQGRLNNSVDNLRQRGGGLDSIFGQLQNALGNSGQSSASSGGLGGIADMAREMLTGKGPGGSASTSQLGGLGALAGGLLGGGVGGAVKGGAMAVLGTLAINALRNAQGGTGQRVALEGSAEEPQVPQSEIDNLTSEESSRTALRSMINAAKADGKIDKDELEAIVGKLSGEDITEEDKSFVMEEIRAPARGADALAGEVRSPAQSAQVYAAALMAIHVDTEDEKTYLRNLAGALGLDDQTVAQLHEMTGASRA